MVQIGEKVVLLPLAGERDNLVAIRPEGAGGYISIPTLTTEERDALTPHTGMVIYNTTTGQLETYDGIQWVGVGVQTPEYTTIEKDLLTPHTGMVIYNTTTGQLETYDGIQWVVVGVQTPEYTTIEKDLLTPSPGMTIFNITTGQLETYDGIQWVVEGVQTPEYTTIERDLLTPSPGMVIYNTTTSQLETYVTNSWTEIYTVKPKALSMIICGGANVITAGEKGCLIIPFSATIKSWTLLGNLEGSIIVDIQKGTYLDYPLSESNSIGTIDIGLGFKAQSSDLTSWATTTIDKDDIIKIDVVTCSILTLCSMSLEIELGN